MSAVVLTNLKPSRGLNMTQRMIRQHRLDPGLSGWIINSARKHYWRVPRWYALDDLIQDGFVCYSVCHRKYPRNLKKNHFMSLVKVSYLNHIHDLANVRTQMSFEVLYPPEDDIWVRATPEEATFVTLLRQAPKEVQELIKCLLSNAHSVDRMKRGDRTWETLNEALCRVVDVDPEIVDIKQVFTEHFGMSS